MKLKKALFVPDTHAPSHDKSAFALLLKVVRDLAPWHYCIVLGDFFDCYSVSDYRKAPEKTFQLLSEELKDGKRILGGLTRATNAKEYVFCEGNHEARIRKYINTYACRLGNLMNTRDILGIPKHWKYLEYGQHNHYEVGDIVCTHGSVCGKYPAANMLAKYGKSVVFGHTHKVQMHVQRTVDGKELQAVSCGWLGDHYDAGEYVSNVADWSLAFAVGYFYGGTSWIDVIRIMKHGAKYCAVYGGKLYEV